MTKHNETNIHTKTYKQIRAERKATKKQTTKNETNTYNITETNKTK